MQFQTHDLVCGHLRTFRGASELVVVCSETHGFQLGVPHDIGIRFGLEIRSVDWKLDE